MSRGRDSDSDSGVSPNSSVTREPTIEHAGRAAEGPDAHPDERPTGSDETPADLVNTHWEGANTRSDRSPDDVIDAHWDGGRPDSQEASGGVVDREWRGEFGDDNVFETDLEAADPASSRGSVVGREWSSLDGQDADGGSQEAPDRTGAVIAETTHAHTRSAVSGDD